MLPFGFLLFFFFIINFLYFYEILLLLSMNILLWVWKISSTDFYSKKSCLYEKKKLNICERNKKVYVNVCMFYIWAVDLCISMLYVYYMCYVIEILFYFLFKVFFCYFDGRGRRKRKQVIQISLINVETLMV